MKAVKKTRQLPSRGGLYDLDRSQRTIVDYAKATPTRPATPTPTFVDLAKRASK